MSSPAPEESAGLAAVRAWCGWHVAPSLTETVKVEGDGGRVLLLPSLHVTAVTEVRNEAGTIIGTDYKWRENGIVRGRWMCEDLYEFDIAHGYDSMPSELQAIVDDIDSAGVGSRLASSEGAGPFSRSFGSSTDLESQPISVRAVIGRYRLPPRP